MLATAAGLVAITIDHLSGDSADDTLIVSGVAGAVTVGFAVLLFAGAIPRAKRRTLPGGRGGETALVTSVVGFLSVASAWTGLPFVLGTGGAILGSAVRRGATHPRQRGLASFAVVVGIVAVALGCVAVAAI